MEPPVAATGNDFFPRQFGAMHKEKQRNRGGGQVLKKVERSELNPRRSTLDHFVLGLCRIRMRLCEGRGPGSIPGEDAFDFEVP